jgi:protein cysQ
MSELLNLAIKAALGAGAEIVKFYSSSNEAIKVSLKDDKSPLTSADLAANEAIIKELEKSGIDICSEESILSSDPSKDGLFWLVDPLDGTKEFLAHNDEFCVCIALIKDTKPILGVIFLPVTRELFYADESGAFKEILDEKNDVIKRIDLNRKSKKFKDILFLSRRGDPQKAEFIASNLKLEQIRIGSAIKFCRLAEFGGVYLRFIPSYLWDNAAGEALVNFCGGKVFDAGSGKDMSYKLDHLKSPFFVVLGKNALNLKDEICKLAAKFDKEGK